MEKINEVISKINTLDNKIIKSAKWKIDNLTKPVGSLGVLEEIAIKISAIKNNLNPSVANKKIILMAGDHGVTEEGVSAYPKEVTKQMVLNFINGGAAINVFARHLNAEVIVVDIGVCEELPDNTKLLKKKVNCGTKNFVKGQAMSREEALTSIKTGINVFEEVYKKSPVDIVATGDMGIGNTTASSAVISVLSNKPVEDITGRGTGVSDGVLENKIKVIKKAIEINKPNSDDPIDVLSKVGGFEIGGLAGVILSAASHRVPVVVDGFISGAASLVAYKLSEKVKPYMITGHISEEKGHKTLLNAMNMTPILNLNMRLGEGTGACLAMSIIEASVKMINEMASFEKAGVSKEIK